MTFPPSFEADPTRRRPSLSEAKPTSASSPSESVRPPVDARGESTPQADERVQQWRVTPSEESTSSERNAHSNGDEAPAPQSAIPPSYAPSRERRRPSLSSVDGAPATDPAAGSIQGFSPAIPTAASAAGGGSVSAAASAAGAGQLPAAAAARATDTSTPSSAAPTQLPPAYLPSTQRERLTSAASSPAAHVPARTSVSQRSSAAPRDQWKDALRQRLPRTGAPSSPSRGRSRRRWPIPVAACLVLLLAWPAFLLWDAQMHLRRVDALSAQSNTPGTTNLLAGSDSRADGSVPDDTQGQRADSIMLVHIAANGQTSMISLPRDTYVEVPGEGWDKLNASFAYGGPSLLVATVEKLTGLTVDHYAEIGMGGVSSIVDAVGGVELCMDMDVEDEKSELSWTAGCHMSDGKTALAFARMRYSDPRGDIGRAERQRQVVSKTVSTAMSPTTFINPGRTLQVERAGASAFTVDQDSSVFDVASLVMAFRNAQKNGMTGTPPIESLGYSTSAGSAVLLQDTTAPDFFEKLRSGTLTSADLQQML